MYTILIYFEANSFQKRNLNLKCAILFYFSARGEFACWASTLRQCCTSTKYEESYIVTSHLTSVILVGLHCNEQCISSVSSGRNATSAILPWAGDLTHRRVNFGEEVLTERFSSSHFHACWLQSCLVIYIRICFAH